MLPLVNGSGGAVGDSYTEFYFFVNFSVHVYSETLSDTEGDFHMLVLVPV